MTCCAAYKYTSTQYNSIQQHLTFGAICVVFVVFLFLPPGGEVANRRRACGNARERRQGAGERRENRGEKWSFFFFFSHREPSYFPQAIHPLIFAFDAPRTESARRRYPFLWHCFSSRVDNETASFIFCGRKEMGGGGVVLSFRCSKCK